jgi:hypothetical protein
VHDGTVLNVHLTAHPDVMHIAPNNRVKPNRALITHHYITDYHRVLSQITILANFWCMTIQLLDNHNDLAA